MRHKTRLLKCVSAANRDGEGYIGLDTKNDCRVAWYGVSDSRYILVSQYLEANLCQLDN